MPKYYPKPNRLSDVCAVVRRGEPESTELTAAVFQPAVKYRCIGAGKGNTSRSEYGVHLRRTVCCDYWRFSIPYNWSSVLSFLHGGEVSCGSRCFAGCNPWILLTENLLFFRFFINASLLQISYQYDIRLEKSSYRSRFTKYFRISSHVQRESLSNWSAHHRHPPNSLFTPDSSVLVSLGISSFLPLFFSSILAHRCRRQQGTCLDIFRWIRIFKCMGTVSDSHDFRRRSLTRSCESIDLQMMWSGLGLSSLVREPPSGGGFDVSGSHILGTWRISSLNTLIFFGSIRTWAVDFLTRSWEASNPTERSVRRLKPKFWVFSWDQMKA